MAIFQHDRKLNHFDRSELVYAVNRASRVPGVRDMLDGGWSLDGDPMCASPASAFIEGLAAGLGRAEW